MGKGKIKLTAVIILFLLLFFTSCYNDRKLGNGYYYLPKYESIDIGYPHSEAIIYKSNREYVFSDIVLDGDVLEVNFNSKFIIAKRDPLINSNKKVDNIQYYIIEKKSDKIFGPMRIVDFNKKAIELQVNLKFE